MEGTSFWTIGEWNIAGSGMKGAVGVCKFSHMKPYEYKMYKDCNWWNEPQLFQTPLRICLQY